MYISRFKVLLLAVLFSVTFSQKNDESEMQELFLNFTIKYNKTYPNETEKMARYQIFKNNLEFIKSLVDTNSTDADKEQELNNGITEFSDMTPQEFQSTYLSSLNFTAINNSSDFFDPSNDIPIQPETDGNFLSNSTLSDGRNLQTVTIPASWDWRTQGAVTSVKYQGLCASCWAFATAANIESLYFRKYGKLVSFSPQQMIDCSTSNLGCSGGAVIYALQYLMQAGGIQPFSSYPPTLTSGACQFNPSLTVAKVQKYVKSDPNETKIKEMVYLVGPITVTMNGNLLQYYTTGIISASNAQCPPSVVNHSVVIVGYGTSPSGNPFWIVKNSYGPNWGENGYFRILRGKGTCGINLSPVTAVLN
jgi:cathepsin F